MPSWPRAQECPAQHPHTLDWAHSIELSDRCALKESRLSDKKVEDQRLSVDYQP